MVLPCVVIMVSLAILPLVYELVLSFHQWFLASGEGWIFNYGLNYIEVITDSGFQAASYNTLIIGGLSLALEFTIGLTFALILNRKIKGRSLLVALLSCPMMLIPVMVGHLWHLMYFRGPINTIVKGVLGYSILWFEDPLAAKMANVFANAWEWAPFTMLILLAGFTAIPVSLYEAAQIDGASSWETFRRITVPMARPLIVLCLLIRGMEQVKLFDVVFLVTGGGPGTETETITLYIFRHAFEYLDMGRSAAASFIVLFVVTIIVTALISYTYRK
jgi:multiple sugar transport system permease protein